MPSNTIRIARNTLMLYFRQILIMLVSLYTVRVVLNTLGAEDYGIYNVVAGVVTMFGFLSGSMASASQRYFSFEIGRGDFEQLKKTFSLSFLIYVLIAALVLLLAETVGLWFVNNKLVMPPERMDAARWVYQFSILSFLFTVLTMPYMAAIIAHEDMNIYAYMSIIEAVLKLGIVFLLGVISADKLQLYGILLCMVAVVNTTIYRTICTKKYQECRFGFYWNKDFFREITSFISWNLFGSIAEIAKTQGITIILNVFFGVIVNAARGLSIQLDGAVKSFSQNFTAAVRPQITKEYAAKNYDGMTKLTFRSAKISYFLMLLFSVPLLFEMPYILKLWLKNPPAYSLIFMSLMLIDSLLYSVSVPIMYVAQATGKIKLYQSVVSSIILLDVPVSFVLLKQGLPPYTVLIVRIILTIIAFFARLIMIKRLVPFSITNFSKYVIAPVLFVSFLSVILPSIIKYIFEESFFRFCISFILSICWTLVCIYFIGLKGNERIYIKNFVIQKLKISKYMED
ncbi:hypothetical protein FACS1894142_1530 [Spirochaetia bacterium]|nr:hypothetical protein FACS1894142_1530 [Spirochaetia bacterium]